MRSRSATTFGRDAELRQLLALADKARAGEAVTVLVHGEAGVGKTRLVSELATSLREQDAIVFVGHGVHLSEGEVPFGVLAESLRDLVRTIGVQDVRDRIGADAEHLAPLVPALRSGGRGEPDRAHVISATADLVESLAADRLVCWVVEDLQWTDTATRDTAIYLTRFVATGQVFLVATWRDEDEGPPRPSADTETIGLRPLEQDDLAALVAAVASELEPPDQARLAELSQGLPFLVEELADSWRPGVGVDPAYLRRLVLTRLPHLSSTARELVELAAVGESLLDARLLEDGLGVDPAAIREVIAAGLLEPASADGSLRFRHALLREAIADAIAPGDRRRLHQRWAEAIADDTTGVGSAPTIALAMHWHGADVPEEALPALAEAARAARQVPAPAAEFGALTKIAAWWDRVPDPVALTGFAHERLLVEALRMGMNSGEYGAVVQLLDDELTRLTPGADPVAEAWLTIRRALFDEDFRHRDAGEVHAIVERLLSAELDDPRFLDGLAFLAGAGLLGDGELRARQRAELALAELAEARDVVWATLIVVSLQLRAGEFEQALATVRAHQAGLDGAPLDEQWVAGVNEAWLLYLLGHPAEAAGILERHRARLSRPSAMAGMYQFLAENLTQSYVALGRWDEALPLASEALQVAPELAASDEVVLSADYLRLHVAQIHLERGDVDAAKSTSELVRALAPGRSAAWSSTRSFRSPYWWRCARRATSWTATIPERWQSLRPWWNAS
jgi:tetratricopeptide (TPR) repeat protein